MGTSVLLRRVDRTIKSREREVSSRSRAVANRGIRMIAFAVPVKRCSTQRQLLTTAIFDVDGVLLASPHERAWREALLGFADPVRFTSKIYQACVAGFGVQGLPKVVARSGHGCEFG
jgi:hypothetical protein